MEKMANTGIYLEPATREKAEKLFSGLGLSLEEAINLFMEQALLQGGLPFETGQKKYNSATEAALLEARKLVREAEEKSGYKSVEELFAGLESEC